VYFGQVRFVEIAKRIAVRPLNQLSPEEDFMLGILLGYERGQQCQRYLARVRRSPRHARLRRDLANTPPCAWPAPQAPSIKLHE
jgi:hypothetical protein